MEIFSPKSSYKNMNFSKTVSTNFYTKSTKFYSSRNNQKSLSNVFGSSTESLKTFKNFSPSSSINKDFKETILYPHLKKSLFNFRRNKSSAFIKNYKRYNNFYRKTIHNKFKSNINLYSNKNLNIDDTPIILFDRKDNKNKINERFDGEKKVYSSPNTSRKSNFTKMYCDKVKNTPYHLMRGEYVNDIEKVLKGNYILLTQRNKYQDLVDVIRYKIDAINNYCFHIKENKKILEKFCSDRNKYLKHLHEVIAKEQDILYVLYGKKDILLIEIKSIYHKIEEKKKIIKQYAGYKLLINSFFNNDQQILSDPNILFEKILSLEKNNLELLKKYNEERDKIVELKKELTQLTNKYNSDHKSLDLSIKSEENEVKRLKEIYFSLKRAKDSLTHDNKKNSFWNRIVSEKRNKINELTDIEVAELETIIDEAKFDKLFKEFPLHFTCVSYYISNIIKFIKNNAPEFFQFNDNNTTDTNFITNYEFDKILNMSYNHKNLFLINENILIMLFRLEKMVISILSKINDYHKNEELSNFIKKKIKEIEIKRKLKNISQKDQIKQDFRNIILDKLKQKHNRIIIKHKRFFSNPPPFIININKNKNHKKLNSQTEKMLTKYNILDNL